MNRLRPNSRIRPVRPYWSRTTLLTVVAVSGVLLFWAATAWFSRTQTRAVELAPSGPYRLVSDIGPINVSQAPEPQLEYRATWLLRGPTASPFTPVAPDGPSVGVGLSCETVMPCRASSNLELPRDAELQIDAKDNDVSIDQFAGDLTVEVSGSGEVFLGPVAGRVRIATTTGGVYGYGLAADEVEIETGGGEVELRFSTRPSTLRVVSGGEAVAIELPDGAYAVSVKGGSSSVIAVEQAASADSEIFVQASGPVQITSKP